jgi:hypothetical protein
VLLQLGTHTPAEVLHEVVPCEFEQPRPQPSQFAASMGVSQPFVVVPSQLRKPALHEPKVQVPVEHEALALVKPHVVLHEPQLVSVRTLRSHPLSGLPSQLSKPVVAGLQPGLHTPPLQLGVPFSAVQV